MPRTLALLLAGVVACYGLNWFLSEFIEVVYVDYVNLIGLAIILAVGLNVVNGLTGQFSIGHAGFMAVGAFVGAMASILFTYGEIAAGPLAFAGLGSFLFCLLLSGLAAGALGVLVGAPALRLRGDYLAIATLGFGEITRILLTAQDSLGGPTGLKRIPKMPLLPGTETWDGGTSVFWIYLFVFLVVGLAVRLQRSTFGRAMIAIRENELAAETMGVPSARLKVVAFVFGAFFAGIAGALYAHYQHSVRPDDFTSVRSIEVIVMLVLGGLGSVTGAIAGAVVVTLLPQLLRPLEEAMGIDGLSMVVYALLLIVMMVFRPQGIFGQRELSLKLLRGLIPGRRGGKTP
ncbi:MAG: branched-chain amino acid ABC transporter permease [Planctomycetes bacterium]|nr:branched-chain amino acid ABC transporter permease [Planctomycetota bacterium]